jgi:hypothetical protein
MTSEFHSILTALRSQDAKGRKDFLGLVHPERGIPHAVLRGKELDQIEVYIWLENWLPEVRTALANLGLEITGEDPDCYLVQAWLPIDLAEVVAETPGVRHIRRPSYGIASRGAATSQGDSAIAANFLRSFGNVDGNGIKVGVISNGLYNSIFPASTVTNEQGRGGNQDSRVRSGDIPPFGGAINTPAPFSRWFGAVDIFPQSHELHVLSGSEVPEGAAILEILYDMAPSAQFFYGAGNTSIKLRQARNFLTSRGVDVIVDNMVFFDAGRYDGTSVISREAQVLAQSRDIVYVTSVGNFTAPPATFTPGESPLPASSSRFPLYINGFFSPETDPGTPKIHNFAAGRFQAGRDNFLTISPQNGVVDVVLVWDDVWNDQNPGAVDDLDLYLQTLQGGQVGGIVSSSLDIQNNSGRPIERITTNPGPGNYALFIRRKDSFNTATRPFTLLILQGTVAGEDVKYLTHGVPLNNSDALAPVISVGAIDFFGGLSEVSFDTIPGRHPGPGRQLAQGYFKWYNGQQAPAVVSYSNTNTVSSGFINADGSLAISGFTGSSAGAAHIGGIVTLLRHARRSVPSYEFYHLLRDTSGQPFPSAVQLHADLPSQFANAPVFVRPNAYDTWANLVEFGKDSKGQLAAPVPTFGEELPWEVWGDIGGFPAPVFGNNNGTLTMSPGGKYGVFGFWQTPLFQFFREDGVLSHELRADRIYELTARVGSDESDPFKVPNFRLRLITGGSDEAITMDISGVHRDAANTPTTIAGKEYKLYYRPTNPIVAKQGVRFALDLAHFDPTDNANATIYLHEVSFRELDYQP